MATKQKQVAQKGVIQWVSLGNMSVPQHAQRELKQYKVDDILSDFDPDVFGVPVVNHKRGTYYILDGQHRLEALKAWLGEGWEEQQIECRVYENLSEKEEAEKFLQLNHTLSVGAFDKFTIGVNAGRITEVAISEILRQEDLRVSRSKVPGAIGAVTSLKQVFNRSNGHTLAKSLRIIRDAYGDSGFESRVIDGVGHLCQRYNGLLDEKIAIAKLSKAHGGVKGLLGKAETISKQTGNSKGKCVAAAAVEIINAGKGGKKLPSWWKYDQ